MKYLLAAESFSVRYGDNHVLKSASLWAAPGQITIVLGRNGSGKTSLIKGMLGAIPAEHGEVFLSGSRVDPRSVWRFSRMGIHYIPDFIALSKRLSILEHAITYERQFGIPVLSAFADLESKDRILAAHPNELSSGECRLSEILLALGRRPRCLLADEPLASVEPKQRAAIIAKLRALADTGAAVVVTGHDHQDLLGMADSVIWQVSGSTQGLGSADEARQNRQFCWQYLEASGTAT